MKHEPDAAIVMGGGKIVQHGPAERVVTARNPHQSFFHQQAQHFTALNTASPTGDAGPGDKGATGNVAILNTGSPTGDMSSGDKAGAANVAVLTIAVAPASAKNFTTPMTSSFRPAEANAPQG